MSSETASKKWKHRGGARPVPHPTPNRKAHARLERRIADYHRMMADPHGSAAKSPEGSFHKPGSYK